MTSEGELRSVKIKLKARIGRKHKSIQDRSKCPKNIRTASEIEKEGNILRKEKDNCCPI